MSTVEMLLLNTSDIWDLMERLKRVTRWPQCENQKNPTGYKKPESVAAHVAGCMAMVMDYMMKYPNLTDNWLKVIVILILHDLTEHTLATSPITNGHDISVYHGNEETRAKNIQLKNKLEEQALLEMALILNQQILGQKVLDLIMEFEERSTSYGLIANHIDRLEAVKQAVRAPKAPVCTIDPVLVCDQALPRITLPEFRDELEELRAEAIRKAANGT